MPDYPQKNRKHAGKGKGGARDWIGAGELIGSMSFRTGQGEKQGS